MKLKSKILSFFFCWNPDLYTKNFAIYIVVTQGGKQMEKFKLIIKGIEKSNKVLAILGSI